MKRDYEWVHYLCIAWAFFMTFMDLWIQKLDDLGLCVYGAVAGFNVLVLCYRAWERRRFEAWVRETAGRDNL